LKRSKSNIEDRILDNKSEAGDEEFQRLINDTESHSDSEAQVADELYEANDSITYGSYDETGSFDNDSEVHDDELQRSSCETDLQGSPASPTVGQLDEVEDGLITYGSFDDNQSSEGEGEPEQKIKELQRVTSEVDSQFDPESQAVDELFKESGSIAYGSFDENSSYVDERSLDDESERLDHDRSSEGESEQEVEELQRSTNEIDSQVGSVDELYEEDGSITYGSFDENGSYVDNGSLGNESERHDDDRSSEGEPEPQI